MQETMTEDTGWLDAWIAGAAARLTIRIEEVTHDHVWSYVIGEMDTNAHCVRWPLGRSGKVVYGESTKKPLLSVPVRR